MKRQRHGTDEIIRKLQEAEQLEAGVPDAARAGGVAGLPRGA